MTVNATSSGMRPIRVGLIGAGNWAHHGHLPVLTLLPEYEIAAIQSRRREVAETAATRFKIPHVIETAEQVARHPDVDLAIVLTTAPQHEAGVRAALAAGKDVYSEWPLSTSTALSESLVELAQNSGKRHVVGLQRRLSATNRYVRDQIANGYVGKLRSVRMHVSMNYFQAELPKALAWTAPPENFSSMMAIYAGHFLDALFAVVGQPANLTALTVNQFSEITIIETGEKIKTTNPESSSRERSSAVASSPLISKAVSATDQACRSTSPVMKATCGSRTLRRSEMRATTSSSKARMGITFHWKSCRCPIVTIGSRPRSCLPPSSNSRTSTSLTPATSRPEHVSLRHSRMRSECTPSST